MSPRTPSAIDWTPPDAPPDGLYGSGARREEKALVLATAGVGTAAVLASVHLGSPGAWAAWQYLVAAVVAFDLLGGVVANGLNTAKRDHFGPEAPSGATRTGRLLRRPVLFAALHVQPVAVGLLFPGADPWWGPAWYAATLAAVVAVRRAPLYLQRPVALAACVGVAVLGPLATAPTGFAWLPVVMVLKLALAHAVQEEPYRPVLRDRGA